MMPKETAEKRAARGLPPLQREPAVEIATVRPPEGNTKPNVPPSHVSDRSTPTVLPLRSSCNECIKLKRACRWGPASQTGDKVPPNDSAGVAASCLLCTRMGKVCSRSTKKRSGPAKGAKYTRKKDRAKQQQPPEAPTAAAPAQEASKTVVAATTKRQPKKQKSIQSAPASAEVGLKRRAPDSVSSSPQSSTSSLSAVPQKLPRLAAAEILSTKMNSSRGAEDRHEEPSAAIEKDERQVPGVEDAARLLLHMLSAASAAASSASSRASSEMVSVIVTPSAF